MTEQTEQKNYTMKADPDNMSASTEPAPAKIGIRIADVSEVVRADDEGAIASWYEQASEVVTLEDLSKLVERLLSRLVHTPATTPHAFTAIALAGLKMADKSEQGGVGPDVWTKIMFTIIQIMTGRPDEPMKILNFVDLMYPDGFKKYSMIPPDVWKWMQDVAKISLVDPASANQPEPIKKHWESIAKGEIPFGMTVGN